MPIDRRRYHPKWSLISRLVRRRAGNRCEDCGADNGDYRAADRKIDGATNGRASYSGWAAQMAREQGVRVVLVQCGTAHLDQDPTNNRFHNLRYLCRACHLAHDRRYNIGKAIITRRYGKDRRQLRLPFQLNIPFKYGQSINNLGEDAASRSE